MEEEKKEERSEVNPCVLLAAEAVAAALGKIAEDFRKRASDLPESSG